MHRSRFDEYVARFNAQDDTAFDDFLSPDMHMQNGTLEYDGVQGMKDHYAKIWAGFTETLTVERFVSDEETLAVQLWTHFRAERDDPASLFGPVRAGTTFDYRGLIMYRLAEDGRFADIKVAYNSFVRTETDGASTELGIPH